MSTIVGVKNFSKTQKKPYQSTIKSALERRSVDHVHVNVDFTDKIILGSDNRLNTDNLPDYNHPFQDEAGRYSIVLDGTIYNYHDLKNELLKNGVVFKTPSHIEIVLQYLIHKGEQGIKDLNGDFALAFYDRENDVFLLARDHLGVKPMLYAIQENEVVFSSDLFAFKDLLDNWSINEEALATYFQFTYIPAPNTIIKEVNKLLPGHYLKVKGEHVENINYFSLRTTEKNNLPYKEAIDQLRRMLEEEVVNRMDFNGSIGSFLSGGVDSSIVSKLAIDVLPDLQTFSVGFVENKFFDESAYAEKVATYLQSQHTKIQLEQKDVLDSITDIFQAFDEPYADSSVLAMYFLTKRASTVAELCLSGDGADEIFGGYNKHQAFLRSQNPGMLLKAASNLAHKLPGGTRRGNFSNKKRQLKKFKQLLSQKWPKSYWMLAEFTNQERRNDLLKHPIPEKRQVMDEESSLRSFLWLDQEFVLPNDMLKKVDIMARYHDLRISSPFLSKNIVSFANALPDDYRAKIGNGKMILKDAFRNKLPDEVFKRSKRGFEIPLREWIKMSFDKIVKQKWFDKEFLQNQALFNFEGVQKLNREFDEGKEEESTIAMWTYIVFQNWMERWKEK